MRAKLAIDAVIHEGSVDDAGGRWRKPMVATLVPVDEIMAVLSIEDPFSENPEHSYKVIEDWVLDQLPTIYQKIDQLTDPISKNLRNQKVEKGLLEEIILKTAANVLVDYIILESGRSYIHDRYSSTAIMHHVFEEVEKAMRRMGLPVQRDSKPKLFSELASHEKLK